MELVLSKLDVPVLEMPKSQISSECQIKSLLQTLSTIGICGKDDIDIIEGTSSQKKQLMFWELLLSTASNKSKLNSSSDDCLISNNEIYKRNPSNQYLINCNYESKICESVNISHLFNTKLQLFPSHLQKEINSSLENGDFPTHAKDIKKTFPEKTDSHKFDVGSMCLRLDEYEDFVSSENENIKAELEDRISESLNSLQNYSNNSFKDAYCNLKPYLSDITVKEFTDIGPAFNETVIKLAPILQLKNSSTLLKSSDSDLEILTSDLSNFQISPGLLSDNLLGEYISCLSETKRKK